MDECGEEEVRTLTKRRRDLNEDTRIIPRSRAKNKWDSRALFSTRFPVPSKSKGVRA